LDRWDCAALVGHVSTAIEALWRWQGSPADGDVEVSAATWLDLGGEDQADQNADFSIRYAAKRTHDQMRDLIAAAVRRGGDTIAATSPDAALLLPLPGIWARFDQAIASRVLELTVHGLDLASAIGSTVRPAPAALTVTGAILDERLDGERPSDLGDDYAWVLAATGRAPHPDTRLPVMR